MQVYAPTSDNNDADIDLCYAQLDETLDSIPRKDAKIVLGDWNAKIDTANDGYEEALGRYGDRNDLGDRLLQYNALLIRGYTSAAENTEHLRPDIGSNTSLPPPPNIRPPVYKPITL